MAAKTLKGITVEINGKTTGLANALKDVTKTSTALSSNLKEINKALKLDPGNTELLNEKQRILSESVAAARKELETLEGVQKQVSDQYANGDIDRGAWLEYQNKLQKAKQHLEDLEKAQKDFGTAAAQTIKEAGAKIEEYGGKASKVGETLTKNVTTPLTAAAAAGVAAFSAVDEGVDTIVTATGASGEALDGLVASYETIATSIPEELGDVASAVGEVNTRFHTTGEELEGQTTLFLQFAKITGGDVVSSVDSADKVLKTFGKTSDDASGLLGMVAKAAQDTGINAQGLMDDVLANSATFKELNFSLEESVNFMALLDENGVESGVALAGLKKAVVNLTDAGMSESEALQTVIDKIKNAGSETEALTIAQETFGTKGAAEMATAIREGRLSLDDLSASMADYSTVVTDTYKAIAPAERLNLCDIATVRFEKLGVNARAKVVQTVYDVLAGRYESITLGEASTNLADTIVAQDKAINAKADTSDLEAAAANASAWITGNKGGYVVLRRNADGQPYELLIMDKPTIEEATKVWRFNKSGLGYSSTGYNGTYGLAMTQDGQIVADYITTGTLSANLLRAGVLQDKTGKVFKLDLDAGTLDANFTSLQVSGKTPEQIAAEQAKEAAAAAEKAAKEAAAADLKEYQTAVEKTVQDLQGQIDGNITTWFYPYAPTAENKPASDWTTETEREAHAGDLFYNTDQASGKAYRWAIVGDVWQWLLLEDTDVAKALANAKTAQDTADGKRRTFISTPVPPYDVGDLWAQGKDGALLACIKKKTGSQLYSADDWTDAANYTKAAEAMLKDYADTVNEQLEGLGQQIDGKTETWFYPYDPTAENEPASGWKTEEDRKAHEGDLFYNTDPASGKAYRWAKDGYTKTAQAAQPKATEYMVTAGPMSAGDKNTIKAQAEALGLPVTVKEC